MTDYLPALDALLETLREALGTLEEKNPNRQSVSQALRYAEECARPFTAAHERSELLRLAAAHLKHADADTGTAQSEALGAARRATTVALFEYATAGVELGDSVPLPTRPAGAREQASL